MTVIEVRFELEKETKGALRYQEIDENGDSRVDPSELIRTPYRRWFAHFRPVRVVGETTSLGRRVIKPAARLSEIEEHREEKLRTLSPPQNGRTKLTCCYCTVPLIP